MINDIIYTVTEGIWLMIPAYIANMSPAISACFIKNPKPLDLGKNIADKRILGDGKTVQGFIFGSFTGIITGLVLMIIQKYTVMPELTIIPIITLSVGTLLGDIAGSFFKRRINIGRGKSLPIIDQLDFVAGAWILTLIFSPDWFIKNFSLPIIITVLIVTAVFHWIFNIIGYKIGVSREPW